MASPDLDLDRVPAALRERPQWLVWRFEDKPGAKKPAKMPYYLDGGRRVGKQGDEADRARLAAFEHVRAAVDSGQAAGLGFAFLPGDGLIGIDLDGVVDAETGEIQERAAAIIRACASFTELSPSGKGVHIYCLGETRSHKSNEIGVEVFCGRQFFTVTGRQFAGSPDEVTAIRPEVVARLHQIIDEARGKPASGAGPARELVQGAGGPDGPAERERIESALACVSADLGYNDWIAVGMALYDALGESVGFTVWDYWSSRGAKYGGAEGLRGHWRSFAGRPPGGDGVIFKLAMAAGWRPPRARAAPPSQGGSPSGAVPAGGTPPDPPCWATEAPPADVLMDGVHDAAEWLSEFRRSEKGNILPSLFNSLNVLEHDPSWRGVLAFDQFAYRIVKRKPPPVSSAREGEWVDIDDVRLQVYLTKTYGFEPKKPVVMDAVMDVAYGHAYHPVREWLEGLKHDGKARLKHLLAWHFGAASTAHAASLQREDPGAHARLMAYLAAAAVKWLVGAVARVMEPGCKLDTMLVLEGGQGVLKSSTFRALFGPLWFADSKINLGDKDALAQMQGKWCYEMAEMDAHRKADDTAFKQFLSSPVDRVRWHYGRRAEDVPRQCIFVGTTNMDHYGKDETGMRRIWPVQAGEPARDGSGGIRLAEIIRDREQLFAEALKLYREGVTWWVDRRVFLMEPDNCPLVDRPWSEWDIFDEQGEQRQSQDAWEAPIVEWLMANNLLPWVTTAQVMGDALKLDMARWTPPEQKRVNAILRRLGWKPKKVGPKNARRAGWVRGDQEDGHEG